MKSLLTKTLTNLFVSEVRIKVLSFFMLNPKKSIHLRGMVRHTNEEVNAVRRELIRLEECKLVICEGKSNRKYYTLNQDHPFFEELISIFHKSFGLGLKIISNAEKLGKINYALLTPVFTKGMSQLGNTKIDMLIIGEVDLDLLGEVVHEEEHKLNREILYMVLKPGEFDIRKRRRDQTLFDIFSQDFVILIGNKSALLS
jgi:hypothetical protein